eukprot:CAMPEP_0170480826 /NCGR_PEP_ID=MMETSP0208-20121228/1511_1 /TAXON_ID=197538 /ORGANISM="Strombidium inclinatum, Strain S3" /LENGTH=177 /DNA_ID=CAMNT_0010753427 /DNA_START=14 /DNA_END=545 /DNA_ORIENTATION=-
MDGSTKALELIGKEVLIRDGDSYKTVTFDEFKAQLPASVEFIGFYFGAHWAPPSRVFTTNLHKDFYSIVNEKEKVFEVIFVTEDKEKGHFDRNYCKMPWAAVPFPNEAQRQTLKSNFGVCDLPTLVVVSTKNWEKVTQQARDQIQSKGKILEAWREKAASAELHELLGNNMYESKYV